MIDYDCVAGAFARAAGGDSAVDGSAAAYDGAHAVAAAADDGEPTC